MADPIVTPMLIGAGMGAMTSDDPLKGAMMGGALGGVGGSMMGGFGGSGANGLAGATGTGKSVFINRAKKPPERINRWIIRGVCHSTKVCYKIFNAASKPQA